MNKSILISINPKWVEKILNREKTIEIRKSMPKCDFPIDVYIYCTKAKPYLYKTFTEHWWWNDGTLEPYAESLTIGLSDTKLEEKFHYNDSRGWNKTLNGFVIAKFTLNKVSNVLSYLKQKGNKSYRMYLSDCNDISWGNKTCLEQIDFENYLGCKNGYAWHIENLEIFDKPLELGNFLYNCQQEVKKGL